MVFDTLGPKLYIYIYIYIYTHSAGRIALLNSYILGAFHVLPSYPAKIKKFLQDNCASCVLRVFFCILSTLSPSLISVLFLCFLLSIPACGLFIRPFLSLSISVNSVQIFLHKVFFNFLNCFLKFLSSFETRPECSFVCLEYTTVVAISATFPTAVQVH